MKNQTKQTSQRKSVLTVGHIPYTGENNFPPSQTVQGEAYTIKQLMERAVNGGQIAGQYEPVFMDQAIEDELVPLIRTGMDLVDLDNVRKSLDDIKQRFENAQQKAWEAKQEKLAAETKARIIEEHESSKQKNPTSKNDEKKSTHS